MHTMIITPREHHRISPYIIEFRYQRFLLQYNEDTNHLHIVHPVYGLTPGVYLPEDERDVLHAAKPTHPAILRVLRELKLNTLWRGCLKESDHCIPLVQMYSDMMNYRPYGPELRLTSDGPVVQSSALNINYR